MAGETKTERSSGVLDTKRRHLAVYWTGFRHE